MSSWLPSILTPSSKFSQVQRLRLCHCWFGILTVFRVSGVKQRITPHKGTHASRSGNDKVLPAKSLSRRNCSTECGYHGDKEQPSSYTVPSQPCQHKEKHPATLPEGHNVTQHIIQQIHEDTGHSGRNYPLFSSQITILGAKCQCHYTEVNS